MIVLHTRAYSRALHETVLKENMVLCNNTDFLYIQASFIKESWPCMRRQLCTVCWEYYVCVSFSRGLTG